MKINVRMSIGFPGAVRYATMEVDDDLSEEELDEIAHEWAQEFIETSWEKKE